MKRLHRLFRSLAVPRALYMTSSATSSKKYTDLFAGGSAYAVFRPTYPQSLFEEVTAYANKTQSTSKSTLCLDIGSGTGQATVELAKHFTKVVGVEGSKSQREAAAKGDNIEYVDGVAEKLPAEDASVDLICAAQAAHWFDLPKFYKECLRALRPGGSVAIWGYAHAQLDNKEALAVYKDFHFKVLGPYWDERRKIVDDYYKDIVIPDTFTRRERVMRSMGKEMTLARFMDYVGTMSALKTYKEKLPSKPDPRIALEEALLKAYNGSDSTKVEVKLTHSIPLILGQKPVQETQQATAAASDSDKKV